MKTATDFLIKQVIKQKFHSGYLLTGPDSERRKEIARGFSKALNCDKKNFFADCDCSSCQKINSGNHPDVKWYGVDEDVRSIKIDEIRDLQNWLSLKSYEGKVKVFILNEADRLTTEAQNALLKSLEEPPPQSVFILLAAKKSDLLDTVISRMVEVKMTPYSEAEIVTILKNDGVQLEDAKFLARFSQGNLGYAKKLSAPGWLKSNRETLKAVVNDKVQGFDSLATKPRKEALEFLSVFASFVRDLCVAKTGEGANFLVSEDRAELLKSISRNKSPESIFTLFEDIEETKKAIEENANQKLAFARLQAIWRDFLAAS